MKRVHGSLLPLVSLTLAALACNVLSPGSATPTFDVGEAATPIPAATEGPPPTEPGAATATLEAAASETPAGAASETPAAADQTFIAYVYEGQLLVTEVTGGALGGTTQYTQPGVDDGVTDFVWSPSGEYIAYTGLIGEDQHVFYVYAEGAGTPVDLGAGAIAAWSPDSTQVAYQSAGQLWLTALAEPTPRQLTAQDNWAWGRPAFMPNGLSLLVTGEAFNDMGASGNTTFWLYSLPLDGSGTLTPLPGMTQAAEGRLPYDLQFSPDGAKLSFSTSWHLSACASLGSYYVANNDGSDLRAVVSPSLDALANEDEEDYFNAYGYAWRPDSAALLTSGLVRDCTDFAGTVLGAQMSLVTLDGAESLIIPGSFAPVSFDRTGATIGASRIDDQTQPGLVQLYDLAGNLVLEVGAGNAAELQP